MLVASPRTSWCSVSCNSTPTGGAVTGAAGVAGRAGAAVAAAGVAARAPLPSRSVPCYGVVAVAVVESAQGPRVFRGPAGRSAGIAPPPAPPAQGGRLRIGGGTAD